MDSIHMLFGWRWHWILCRLGIHSWKEKYQCRRVGYYDNQDCIYCPKIKATYDPYKGWSDDWKEEAKDYLVMILVIIVLGSILVFCILAPIISLLLEL